MTQHTYQDEMPIEGIFRSYDIRGIANHTLTPNIIYTIAKSIGTEIALKCDEKKVVIARDGRLSGPVFIAALSAGLQATGCDVIDVGMVPTPLLYFATHFYHIPSAVMLTGSHNPQDDNGLKIVINHEHLSEERIRDIYIRICRKDFSKGHGFAESKPIVDQYIADVVSRIKLKKPLNVVIDTGNGVCGPVASKLFKQLGCQVTVLYGDIDGHFPHHMPDPAVATNLRDLIAAVKNTADIGLAFDGDGDRLGVVTNLGDIIWPDYLLMLFAEDFLSKQEGAEVLYDVKCSRHLADYIKKRGGEPLMWKTGHSLIKRKMRERHIKLAGEMSGHFFFKDAWYGFDDGLYAGAKILEIISNSPQNASELLRGLPQSVCTPELKMFVPEEQKFALIEKIQQLVHFENAAISMLDGLRVDFQDGFALVRVSNTTPNLTFRFEADSENALQRIKDMFREKLLAVEPTAKLPF